MTEKGKPDISQASTRRVDSAGEEKGHGVPDVQYTQGTTMPLACNVLSYEFFFHFFVQNLR
jgi:hypothetical protein